MTYTKCSSCACLTLIFFSCFMIHPAPAKCKNLALDLAVVLETSTELGEEHFRHGRDFLKQVVNLIDISQNETHVSIVLFNKHVDIIVALDQSIYHSNEAVNRVFRVLPALFESGKRLDLALKYLHSSVFTKLSEG